jgi:hypothetical protein
VAILNTRDFNLQNLSLITSAGVIDIRYIMNEISYNEDLFGGFISGYVMITESNAYSELLALTGNEFLILTFSKNNNDTGIVDTISKKFRVYKIDKRKLVANMYTEAYFLNFCSEELLLSEQYKISKSYPNQQISQVITDICINNLGISGSKLDIEETYGLYDFVIPNIKPLDAINWLSNYARPNSQHIGADMLFFEDRNGFNFKSLQTLTADADSDPFFQPYGKYRYDPKNLNDEYLTEEIYNVTTYEILNSYDSLNAINSGMFANQLISVDILTRKKITTDFDYFKYWNDPDSGGLNLYPVTNNYQNRFGKGLNETSQATLKLVFSNFDEANNAVVQANPGSVAHNIYAETYIPYRTAQLALANYTRIKMSIPGDPILTVGKVIEFELLSRDPSSKEQDFFYSGNYLVTAVKHMITQNDFKTVLEIAKDSVPHQFPDIDTTVWSNIVSS